MEVHVCRIQHLKKLSIMDELSEKNTIKTKLQLFWSEYKSNQDKEIFCLHQCCAQ